VAWGALALCGALTCPWLLWSGNAEAALERRGTWPAEEPAITLDLKQKSRSDALEALADQAEWSVVFRGEGGVPVDVHVRDQPADKVLELLLGDGDFVAKRDGTLISIAAAEPATPAPAAGPAASAQAAKATGDALLGSARNVTGKSGKDRAVTGSDVRIGIDEVVRDVSVMGGSAEILGVVTGDLVVVGGELTLAPSARVRGDVAVTGGDVTLASGSQIDGDRNTIGGSVERAEGAKVPGDVSGTGSDTDEPIAEKGNSMNILREVGQAISNHAVLFVFGAVLLALATRRMENVQAEIAGRPMRSFALGVVGYLVALVALLVLCITIIGIPVAVVAVMAAVFAAYSGICAVLTTVGASLLQHRTRNVYLHLALGCGLFLVLGSLPFIGGFVSFAVVTMGVGAVIATRGAGLIPPSNGNGGPYRTATI
jgi:hypothetical protein